jgi:glycosyltransferase involved in cell wall biosynthesis
MRIAYLCGDLGVPLDGHKGAAAHVRGLVRAFAALGHEVSVLASEPGVADLGVPVLPIEKPALLGAILPGDRPRVVSALRHVWNNVAVEYALNEALARYHADLLYERYSPFGVAGGLVARRRGIPHILEVNASLAWEGGRYRRQALQEAAEVLEAAAFGTASMIVAVSRELRGYLLSAAVPAEKVVVVPNGVDPDLFAPEGPAHRAGLEGRFVVGFVGSLKAWHGVDVLAEAFRALAIDPRFHLLVVGDGPMARVLRSLAEELPGQVSLVGAVPQAAIPAYLRAMDVAVAPYPILDRFYYSPLKVLEYMAAGRVAGASRCGPLVELIRDGETGLLVPPGEAAALAGLVRELAEDEDRRRAIGARAAAEVRRAHTWAHRAGQILELARMVAVRTEPSAPTGHLRRVAS